MAKIDKQSDNSRKVSDLVKYFDNISNELEDDKIRLAGFKPNQKHIKITNPNNHQRNKSDDIIEELLKTEETYFQILRHIIGDYIFHFKRDIDKNIFKHLEDLGKYQVMFYVDLLESKENSERIGKCFLKHKQLFRQYKIYIRDMYDLFDILSNRYNKLIEGRRQQLGDDFRLTDQLLTPFQRLTRYILLLRNLLKEQKDCDHKTLEEAIAYLESIAAELNLNS